MKIIHSKFYNKHYPFASSEVIHALERNEKQTLMQHIKDFPVEYRRRYLKIVLKFKKGFFRVDTSSFQFDKLKARCEALILKLETKQQFSEGEISDLNYILHTNRYGGFFGLFV